MHIRHSTITSLPLVILSLTFTLSSSFVVIGAPVSRGNINPIATVGLNNRIVHDSSDFHHELEARNHHSDADGIDLTIRDQTASSPHAQSHIPPSQQHPATAHQHQEQQPHTGAFAAAAQKEKEDHLTAVPPHGPEAKTSTTGEHHPEQKPASVALSSTSPNQSPPVPAAVNKGITATLHANTNTSTNHVGGPQLLPHPSPQNPTKDGKEAIAAGNVAAHPGAVDHGASAASSEHVLGQGEMSHSSGGGSGQSRAAAAVSALGNVLPNMLSSFTGAGIGASVGTAVGSDLPSESEIGVASSGEISGKKAEDAGRSTGDSGAAESSTLDDSMSSKETSATASESAQDDATASCTPTSTGSATSSSDAASATSTNNKRDVASTSISASEAIPTPTGCGSPTDNTDATASADSAASSTSTSSTSNATPSPTKRSTSRLRRRVLDPA
ncbi:hypothetical protein GYMLUDRAFT_63899 [Collybiopsis luxurians FD-317 M1]|uniref:Uncharacterized protein n=1 Tax=Collybiopsis luxurians FD-317 M1 TaxID=944289 RepID=A0A0D0C5E0_9AGAR|nr:hypothetical protein GYMLUDRAFT_63899 [Collybiopsis luxurians FD-317 M1]